MLKEWCWYLRVAEVVGSSFGTYLHSSRFLKRSSICIARTATTISKHFHVTCQLPGNRTMQLRMYMIYWGCCFSVLIMQEQFQLLEERNFNAVIGNPLPRDEDDLFGTCGLVPDMIEAGCLCGGRWNMVCLSRLVWIENIGHDDTWICQRSVNGVPVQMNYILSCVSLQLLGKAKYDFAMPVGLDHVCVHCTMKIPFHKNGFENNLVSSVGAPF